VPVTSRARRVGENEALFRSVNEQVHDLNQSFLVEGRLRIVCECAVDTCLEQIDLLPGDYEAVRADAELFIVKPEHDDPSFETVEDRKDDYWIVRKNRGEPEQIAHETDPRG
jgi:hypothetical protein